MKVAVIKFCAGYNRSIEDWDYSNGGSIIVDEETRGPTGWHSYAAATQGFVMLYEGLEADYEKINDADKDLTLLEDLASIGSWIESLLTTKRPYNDSMEAIKVSKYLIDFPTVIKQLEELC